MRSKGNLVGIVPRLLLLAGFFVLGCAPQGHAQSKKAQSAELRGAKYHYYDGTEKKDVWMNPRLIVEFQKGKPSKHAPSVVQQLDPEAKEVGAKSSRAKVWKLGEGEDADQIAAGATKEGSGTAFSPVFHSQPSEEAPMRALPGGILVQFKKDWDEGRVRAWVAKRGFRIRRKLSGESNHYLLEGEPGLGSLRRANEIYESGEVLRAEPDWWQEFSFR